MRSLGEKVIRGCNLNLASSWKRGLTNRVYGPSTLPLHYSATYRVYEHWGGLTLPLAAEKGQKKLA